MRQIQTDTGIVHYRNFYTWAYTIISWVTLGSFQKVCVPPFRSEDANS